MLRWHKQNCNSPTVVTTDHSLACETCSEHIQLETLKPPHALHHPLPAIPPDEPLGELNLSWPSSVSYYRPATTDEEPAAGTDSKFEENHLQISATYLANFIYSSRLGSDEFRLLHLHPILSSSQDVVHAEIHTYKRDRCPEFETVSYTWGGEIGDSSLRKPIFLGSFWDALFQTQNCWEMLQQLRRRVEGGDRVLWVDAICINQEDTIEREDQVAQMRQIYQDASQVVVFLGADLIVPPPAGSALCWRYNIHEIQKRTADSCDLPTIFEREYFKRVWVVQELVLSERALFRIGDIQFFAKQSSMERLAKDSDWN